MVAEARRPPVLQQPKRNMEAGDVGFEIAVVLQDVERLVHGAGYVVVDGQTVARGGELETLDANSVCWALSIIQQICCQHNR